MSARLTGLVHKYFWHRLPPSWRRAALFRATVLAAPRPTPGTRAAGSVIVAGVLRTASGLGESARLCHDTLQQAGVGVLGVDLSAELMQPVDVTEVAFSDGRAFEGPGTLILHVNSPLVPLALCRLGRRVVRDNYIIGYWAWELPDVPPDWRHGIPFVHEIWVPSAFTADAVRPTAGERPVRVVPHPVAIRGLTAVPYVSRPERPFTVLTVFNAASSFARKNPCATVEAFRKAFGNDQTTRLIVKASNLVAFPKGIDLLKDAIGTNENIVVIADTIGAVELDALYAESDVVMSLHRSEGFGLTLAEAMLRGLPVVATNWSGNVDFVSAENGIPIPYRLIPAEDPQGTYHHPDMMWADANIEAAATALRRLRREPELARRLGEAGAAFAARAWGAQGYAETVRRHLGL